MEITILPILGEQERTHVWGHTEAGTLRHSDSKVWGLNHDAVYIRVCSQSLSRVQLFATPWTVAHQAPLSVELSRQEY